MTLMIRLAAAAAFTFTLANEAQAIVLPSLDGQDGNMTQGFNAIDTATNTTTFTFDLTGPAAGDLVLSFFSGAFGEAIQSASFMVSGADGSIDLGTLTSGQSATLMSSMFGSAGSYVIEVMAGVTNPGVVGSYELAVAVTPLPAALAFLAPALAGLGLVARRKAALAA